MVAFGELGDAGLEGAHVAHFFAGFSQIAGHAEHHVVVLLGQAFFERHQGQGDQGNSALEANDARVEAGAGADRGPLPRNFVLTDPLEWSRAPGASPPPPGGRARARWEDSRGPGGGGAGQDGDSLGFGEAWPGTAEGEG